MVCSWHQSSFFMLNGVFCSFSGVLRSLSNSNNLAKALAILRFLTKLKKLWSNSLAIYLAKFAHLTSIEWTRIFARSGSLGIGDSALPTSGQEVAASWLICHDGTTPDIFCQVIGHVFEHMINNNETTISTSTLKFTHSELVQVHISCKSSWSNIFEPKIVSITIHQWKCSLQHVNVRVLVLVPNFAKLK